MRIPGKKVGDSDTFYAKFQDTLQKIANIFLPKTGEATQHYLARLGMILLGISLFVGGTDIIKRRYFPKKSA